jgi:hypothetical protein
MASILVHVDETTYARLRAASNDLQRTIEDLAESAVSEAALKYAKDNGHE